MHRFVTVVVVGGFAAASWAQYTTPNVINAPGPIASSLNGTQFVNSGLVGVGRIPAFLDAQGSTFGSASGIAMAPGSWSFDAATGQYSGRVLTLPDRGRNDPVTSSFLNYQNRIQKLDFTFTPLSAGSGASQNQMQFNYQGLTLLHESNGNPIVGNDPGAEVGNAFGRPVPRKNGNMALDAEALVAMPDGGYYVSDEYGSAIYRFDAAGTLQGVINPPEAMMPRDAQGNINFTSISAPASGRRNNQGMEGLSLTPDGKHLIAVNQSAAMQDSPGNQANRRDTRVLVYDISQDPTPAAPVGHYVLELPTLRNNGDGGAVDRTASQSEIVALSDTQFLFLPRDSNGRGPGTGLSPVFKSIMMADISAATNLIGTPFNGATAVSPGGLLDPSIMPASKTEVVNLLNLFDLNRFGLNLDIDAAHPFGDANTLSEKWEGLSLMPDLATTDPTDFFLFVSNDNDFLTTNGMMLTADGQAIAYSDALDHDTMFLVYRVNIIPGPGAGAVVLGALGLGVLRRRREAATN